jgi:vacuolar-type H+-ATPase subunit H
LINKGFSFEEAQKVVEDTLKKRREQIEEEYKKLNEEEKDVDKRKNISKDRCVVSFIFHDWYYG